jgi:hypothetical protein
MSNLTTMLRSVRKIERSGVPGTGLTVLKQRPSPIGRLLDRHQIGPEELAAAEDIALAFRSIAGELMLRPATWERADRSKSSNEPVRVLDAIARYREWVDVWAIRAKRGDPTLKIVLAVVIEERPLRDLDGQHKLRNGRARAALIAGLRDYAARAGWIRSGLVERGAVFRLLKLP